MQNYSCIFAVTTLIWNNVRKNDMGLWADVISKGCHSKDPEKYQHPRVVPAIPIDQEKALEGRTVGGLVFCADSRGYANLRYDRTVYTASSRRETIVCAA